MRDVGLISVLAPLFEGTLEERLHSTSLPDVALEHYHSGGPTIVRQMIFV